MGTYVYIDPSRSQYKSVVPLSGYRRKAMNLNVLEQWEERAEEKLYCATLNPECLSNGEYPVKIKDVNK